MSRFELMQTKNAELVKAIGEIKAALNELYVVLEAYAPIWYTPELHDRAAKALQH